MADKHRVVILGGGFAGLNAAKQLKHSPVDVTLIDRRNFHLFQPLLYQVATGSLSPGEISAPIRGVLSSQSNASVLLGEAVDIDPEGQFILLRDGDRVPYDTLIAATGTQSTYFGNDRWSEWAPPLKSIEDATAIRHKILFAFEAAERVHDNLELKRAWMTFVIVGAGATGVELAGALGEIASETLRHDFHFIKPEEAKILVVDGSPRLLPAFAEDLARKAEKSLLSLGVRIKNNIKVTDVDDNGVSYEETIGEEKHNGRISAKTVLWAAGVAVTPFTRKLAERTGATSDRQGRIEVNPDLTVGRYKNIYVVGDHALGKDPDGKPLPGVAQVAMQEGSYAGKAVRQRLKEHVELKPFRYFNKGDLAVIGRGSAIANVFGVHVSGLLAWLIWLFIHLMYIVEFQNRLVIFVQWAFLYITMNRGARLITGHVATDILRETKTVRNTPD